MTTLDLVARSLIAPITQRSVDLPAVLEERFQAFAARGFQPRAFDLRAPGGRVVRIGSGEPAFTLGLVNERGRRALASFDELAIAEGYLNGDIDLDGDMIEVLKFRDAVADFHPLQYLVSTYLEPLVAGQVKSDRKWIKSHYDVDPEFFVLWLDKRIRGYSHAFFERDDESLEDGMERKFRYAMAAARIKSGDRVLDIGGGWGSFLEFAGKQGVHVTSVTISDVSHRYMSDLVRRHELPATIVKEHFLDFRPSRPFDAIVNLGVTEHLPDYASSVKQYERLLAPGGRVYLDSYTGQRFHMPAFVLKWVYEGNTSPLNLGRYFAALEETSLEVIELVDDRHNYYLTCKKWAENLEAARDEIIRRWGQPLYRRFHLYLWASANSFLLGRLSAHHLVLEKPVSSLPRSTVPRALVGVFT